RQGGAGATARRSGAAGLPGRAGACAAARPPRSSRTLSPRILGSPQNENGPAGARSGSHRRPSVPRPGYPTAPILCRERRPAAAARLGLGVDERETPLQSLGDVVERGAVQVEIALGIADHGHPIHLELLVVGPQLGVELERIRQPRAAPALHAHAQEDALELLLLQNLIDVLARRLRQYQCNRSLTSLSLGCAARGVRLRRRPLFLVVLKRR